MLQGHQIGLYRVRAGFPSPAADYVEEALDLNAFVTRHPAATFFFQIEGQSMVEANLHPGDVIVVDRALDPRPDDVIIAGIDGAFTVKTLRLDNGRAYLEAANPEYPPLEITAEAEFLVWGVVTHVLHRLR